PGSTGRCGWWAPPRPPPPAPRPPSSRRTRPVRRRSGRTAWPRTGGGRWRRPSTWARSRARASRRGGGGRRRGRGRALFAPCVGDDEDAARIGDARSPGGACHHQHVTGGALPVRLGAREGEGVGRAAGDVVGRGQGGDG